MAGGLSKWSLTLLAAAMLVVGPGIGTESGSNTATDPAVSAAGDSSPGAPLPTEQAQSVGAGETVGDGGGASGSPPVTDASVTDASTAAPLSNGEAGTAAVTREVTSGADARSAAPSAGSTTELSGDSSGSLAPAGTSSSDGSTAGTADTAPASDAAPESTPGSSSTGEAASVADARSTAAPAETQSSPVSGSGEGSASGVAPVDAASSESSSTAVPATGTAGATAAADGAVTGDSSTDTSTIGGGGDSAGSDATATGTASAESATAATGELGPASNTPASEVATAASSDLQSSHASTVALTEADSSSATAAAAEAASTTQQPDSEPPSSSQQGGAAYGDAVNSSTSSPVGDASQSSQQADSTLAADATAALLSQQQTGEAAANTATQATDNLKTESEGPRRPDEQSPKKLRSYDELTPDFKENVVQTTMTLAADVQPDEAWTNFTTILKDLLKKSTESDKQRRRRRAAADVEVQQLAGSPRGPTTSREYEFEYYATAAGGKPVAADRLIADADSAAQEYNTKSGSKVTVGKTTPKAHSGSPPKPGESHDFDDNPHYVKAILGIIGALAGLIIIVILAVWLINHRRTRSFQLTKTSQGGSGSNGYRLDGIENPVMAEEMQSEPKTVAPLSSKPTNGHTTIDKADEEAMIIPLDQLQGDANV